MEKTAGRWQELTGVQRWLPLALVAAYWIVLVAIGGMRGDHVWLGAIFLVLSYGGSQARVLLRFLLPLGLTAVVYDSQRFYSDYLRGPIHVVEPYAFDRAFFGIRTSQGVLTPNEWWQHHVHPVLDLYAGFFYLTFIAIFVLIAAAFYFHYSQRGTARVPAQEVARTRPQVMWSFFWVNCLGYSTYYWYPAAPPWYAAQYGFGPARLDVNASPAGALRFDELLGTHFFTDFYGRSADVFGAIPSLHVAYPLIAVYFAFRYGALRGVSIVFYLSMCFAAVYLNHHYVVDVILGSTYAIIVATITEWWFSRRQPQLQSAGEPGPSSSVTVQGASPQKSKRKRPRCAA